MRVKSHWFQAERSKTPKEVAGAAATNLWRVGVGALTSMRRAGFEIETGPQYFAFLAEYLVFLVLVADRIAYRHYDEQQRQEFTGGLANWMGDNLADNRVELLGGDRNTFKAEFIALLNARADDYAQFEYEKDAENFSFIRCLGTCLEGVMDDRDKTWVIDQVMALEAPEALSTAERTMRGLLELEPHTPRRASATSGE